MSAHPSSRQHRQRTLVVLATAAVLTVAYALIASGSAPVGAAARISSPAHAAAAGRVPAANDGRLPAWANGAFKPPTKALTPANDLNAAAPDAATLTSARSPLASAQASPASYPLHTSGRWIVNAQGQRVKLAAVNWDGAESAQHVVGGLEVESVDAIASWIKAEGFNAVRIPWSNEMYEFDPAVPSQFLSANPSLEGKTALQVLDAVIAALGRAQLMVILDDHQTDSDIWCCSTTDYNGLWYTSDGSTPGYNEDRWIADWQGMASRYANNPAVVGAELRNEIRAVPGVSPVWGGGAANDWHRAAERGGDAVLGANPNLLIFVDGLNYAGDLRGVAGDPVVLSHPGQLVYAAHAYNGWYGGGASWSGWYSINGYTGNAPAATEFNPGGGNQPQLLVFTRGTDGQVYENAWSEPSGPWTGWYAIGQGSSGGGGDITGSPAVAQFGQQVEVFGTGTNGHVWGNVWTLSSGTWSGWFDIGGNVVGDPTVTTYTPPGGQQPQLLVFARGPDGQVYENVYAQSSGKWTGWYSIGSDGTETVGNLSAAAFGHDQVQLFSTTGQDGAVYQKVWTYGSGWSAWQNLGGSVTSSPSAVDFGDQQMQVFARGTNGQVYADVWTAELSHGTWTGNGSWTGWYSIGGGVISAPAAAEFGSQMQVFAEGTNTQVYVDKWDPGYQQFHDNIGKLWGYIITQGQSYTAPVWVSEWGTCMTYPDSECTQSDADFFNNITQYLKDGDFDFAYWQLGGEIVACGHVSENSEPDWSGSGCASREADLEFPGYDWYALANPWDTESNPTNVSRVKALEAPTQGP